MKERKKETNPWHNALLVRAQNLHNGCEVLHISPSVLLIPSLLQPYITYFEFIHDLWLCQIHMQTQKRSLKLQESWTNVKENEIRKDNQWRERRTPFNLKLSWHFELYIMCTVFLSSTSFSDFKLAGERCGIRNEAIHCEKYHPAVDHSQAFCLRDIIICSCQLMQICSCYSLQWMKTRSEREWSVPDGTFQIRNGKTRGIYFKTTCFYCNSKHIKSLIRISQWQFHLFWTKCTRLSDLL